MLYRRGLAYNRCMTAPVPYVSEDRQNFEHWFGAKLKPLMEDPTAGFVCAMVGFPLLERYLRRKSGSEPKTKLFNLTLYQFLQELGSIETASDFWQSYRHGLLHNVRLNADSDWLTREPPVVKVTADKIRMNPALFLERVVETIRGDFEIFAKEPGLPQVGTIVEPTGLGSNTFTVMQGTGGQEPAPDC